MRCASEIASSVRWNGGKMLSSPIPGHCHVQFPPLAPSMITSSAMMPATEMSEVSNACGDTTAIALMGLSTMSAPTAPRSTTHVMFTSARCSHEPMPLSSSSCGLPSAPAHTMTSSPTPSCRYAKCVPFRESVYSTPVASGFLFSSTTTAHLVSGYYSMVTI